MARKKPTPAQHAAQLMIGSRIFEARRRLGVSQELLGLAFGVTRQGVQFWEKGGSLPPADEIPRLCSLLGVDANYLLGVSPHTTDVEAIRSELLRLAEESRYPRDREGPARKVPGKRSRRSAAAL
jgi:transcriptional regulator with XRE-family HTH domain